MYKQKEKNYASLVIYLHNDETIVEKNLLGIDQKFSEYFSDFEIILINDFSDDKSIEKVKSIQNQFHAPITILNLSYYHGLELAMVAGQKVAIGDYIFEFDTLNIDYELENLIDLYKKSLSGYDIVSLSPSVKPSFFNKVFYRLLEVSSLRKMKLYTETARILSRRAVNRVGILNQNINYRKAAYHYSGLPSSMVFYKPNHKTNYNQLSFTAKFNLGYEILLRYSHVASTISISLSMLFFAFSIFMILFVIGSYVVVQNIASGWTTTMMFLTISFSGLFLVLSMILKYLDMLLREKSLSKSYVYDSIEQLKNK